MGASSGRGRQARTMEDARALIFLLRASIFSVRTGHVPVITNSAFESPSSMVSQPVDANAWFPFPFSILGSVSACLKA